MIGRAHCLALWVLLCPPAAWAEQPAQRLPQLAPSESKLERVLPDSLQGEARAAPASSAARSTTPETARSASATSTAGRRS